jgi:hypothetical protein
VSTKRKWVPIAIGVAILLLFVGIGAVVVSVSYARDHVHVSQAGETEAQAAFDEVYAKYPGPALITLRDGAPVSTPNETSTRGQTELTTLHVLAWDRQGQLMRAEIPFWLLRLKSGPIGFSSYASGMSDDRVRLTVADIERRGPGIVIDAPAAGDRKGRLLIWAD